MSTTRGIGTAAGSNGAGIAPPHNLEAEQSVLGAVLLSDRAMYKLVIDDGLRPEHFYRERHRVIYEAMLDLYNRAEPVDALMVTENLRQSGQLESVGGAEAVTALVGAADAPGNVRYYAQIVRDNALLRGLLGAAYEVQQSVATHAGPPRELVERAEKAMLEVAQEERRKGFIRIDDVLHEELEKLHRLSTNKTAVTGTPSGFRDLDLLTGGFQPGNLVILAARPSMGKSSLVTNIAEHAAIDHDCAVALFSLEMSESELAQRFIASQARIRGEDLRKGKVPEARWSKILHACERLSRAPLYIDDSSDVGLLDIRAKARRLHSQHDGGLGLVIVDYLQLMRADGRTDNRVEQVSQMSRGLKVLARELDVPVIALSQLNRAVEQRKPPKPILADLRESGCLAAESRVLLPDSGRYVPIGELAGATGFKVLALDPRTWTLEPRPARRAFGTGNKRVLALRTSLGRELRATANHRFLTIDGWRRLDELEPGVHVALPRELDSVQSDDLAHLAAGDVYWDRVTSIEPGGIAEVFDIEVEGLHNFVAEDVVVHKSIEQDADVVIFIYRDEYYEESSEREGEADLLVQKHRNGPLGSITLTFQKEYPRFVNYAPEGFGQ
jgi:replicative DNA helicase